MTRLSGCLAMVAVLALTASCDPIEPKSKAEKEGTPISAADLKAALSYKQMPNVEGEVKGDQYIIVHNARPDIGGTWHLVCGDNDKAYGTDRDTIVATGNGDYQLYYMGVSGGQIVRTEPFELTVTNVFDDWSGYITGAKDKADKAAKRIWKFREVSWGGGQTSICNNGAYGGWKYVSAGYVPESNFAWWGNHTGADAADYKMIFGFDGSTLSVSDATGAEKYAGSFSFTHDVPDEGVLGELITNVPLIGAQWDDCRAHKNGESNVFWILTLTDRYMTLFHPDTYTGGEDWSNCGWYIYLEAAN